MKRTLRVTLLSLTLVCAVLLSSSATGTGFFTRRVEPEPGEVPPYYWNMSGEYVLRYTDTGELIPLSFYYDGSFLAPVPEAYRDRVLTVCKTEPLTFTDEAQYGSGLYEMEVLSQLGVMGGNDRGEAEPLRELTRAEAAAILVRLVGAPPQRGARYADVPTDAWFAEAVSTAQALGVVMPDERFYPERPVTRQEFTVMTARAFQAVGLLGDIPAEVDMSEIGDVEAVAEYALPAYRALFAWAPLTAHPETDHPFCFEPEQPITREGAARLLYQCRDGLPVYPTRAAEEFGLAEAMPRIDGSTSTLPLTEAVYPALFSNSGRHPARPAGHSKTHQSYQRLISGEVDAVFAGVVPGQDIYDLAAEQGVELQLIPIGYDAMVFFTNEKNPIPGLTSEQITALYVHNTPRNWAPLGGPDAALVPICRNEDSGSHANMERYFLKGAAIHPEIRREPSLGMENIFTDVVKNQSDDPPTFALGYSVYYYYQSMERNWDVIGGEGKMPLRLLAIDGVEPTDETIADGSYPLADFIYLVLRKDTPKNAPARRLADFMLSEKGQVCVAKAGFGPLR